MTYSIYTTFVDTQISDNPEFLINQSMPSHQKFYHAYKYVCIIHNVWTADIILEDTISFHPEKGDSDNSLICR